MNVFSVRAIGHNHGHWSISLWPVDVASHQAFKTFEFDRNILLKYVRIRFVIDHEQIVSDFVGHFVVDSM